MTRLYLGLGSNCGDRRQNMRLAIRALLRAGVQCLRAAPVIETDALLLPDSPADWDRPYLNTVIEACTVLSPVELLSATQAIERELGRAPAPRWSPRTIDIDVLVWGEETVNSDVLTIPHVGIRERDFVLGPLVHLRPDMVLPGDTRTVLEHWLELPRQTPVWMGIMNLTPDSFSDGGELHSTSAITARLQGLFNAGAHYVDMGAESTRPGAGRIDAEQEWARLAPAIARFNELREGDWLAPRLSIDTRNAAVAEQALAAGADVINDVSGLGDAAMIALARSSEATWVAMHATAIPANPKLTLPTDRAPYKEVFEWFVKRQALWDENGIARARVMVDPGVGFGKTAAQSWALLQEIEQFHGLGQPVLVGHSRKSFIKLISEVEASARDPETLALSLGLQDRGIGIFRVHDVAAHQRAYRSWRRLGQKLSNAAKPD